MKPRRTRTIFPAALTLLVVLLTLGTMSCAGNAPQETLTPTAESATVQPQTASEAEMTEQTAPSATSSGLHPSDLRTGITGLDPVLEALASGDTDRLVARLRLLETPCTTADGLGGPPKCPEGVADGTTVTVFPTLGSEGSFVTEDGLRELVERLEIAGLFGIYIVPEAANPEEAYWPSGQYGVVLTGSGPVPAYTLLVEGGDVVRIIYHLGESPEEAFDGRRGDILVPPLQ